VTLEHLNMEVITMTYSGTVHHVVE